ncbi:MAG: DUF3592 domain-containing protein, partial [Anaerolineae bacterium]|nr:DUF3592 domain-containing protein [Anaerolineae bacterium]
LVTGSFEGASMNLDFMNNMGSVISGAVAIPFVIVALFFVFLALRASRRASVSRSWPATTGKVLAAGIEPRRGHSSNGGSYTSYYPVVQYEYTVNGQRYLGNRINVGNEVGYGWTNMAQRQIDGYAPGSSVAVFYDPNEPANAVLERTAGTSGKIYWFVAILIFVILGVTMVFTSGINNVVSGITSNLPR